MRGQGWYSEQGGVIPDSNSAAINLRGDIENVWI